jgi:phenylalanyl-tRNA synthetase beta chain
MKVSLNTIKKYTDVDLSVDELIVKINAQLGGVENVIDLGERYKDALIVKVVECEKHSNADKLSVCQIDIGTKELVQVVCGAPNVRAGMYAVWLPPKSTVPASFEDKEPFVIDVRELRGIISNGMLASPKELGISDSHEGLLEINENDEGVKPGASFSKTYGLDDTIIEIENKMFTHRPDLFGQLGVAREIAGIQNKQFAEPEWYWEVQKFESADSLDFEAVNESPEKVPRFMALALKNIEVKPSPLWLQCELIRLGSKPINNVVDATNYIMLLTAQPTHAYDYDKLRGHKLVSRLAKKGESVKLLNDKTYELNESDIVIADEEGPVGLAGIMGGGESEVSDETKNIVLEVATFDMYTLRRSSMRHGVFTDALSRFNKGQSPLQNDRVMSQLLNLIIELTNGEQASDAFDLQSPDIKEAYDAQSLCEDLRVEADFINKRLGLSLPEPEIERLLRNVQFASSIPEGESGISFTSPFWRTDIELPEDIVEEIGRLYGFDKLPRELPKRTAFPTKQNQKRQTKQRIRESLTGSGANEVLTYSFVHENVLKKADQDIEQAFELSNALSPDLQYYRLSVLPSLLDKVHMNIKAGHDEFVLFEIGKGHNKKYHANDDDGLPRELEFVDAVYSSKNEQQGAAYYKLKRFLEQLASDLGFNLKYVPIKDKMDYPVTAPFDQDRSALVETSEGIFIGMIGELKQEVIRSFKLPSYSAAMTLDFEGIDKAYRAGNKRYNPISKYPSISQDISIKVDKGVLYQDLFNTTLSVLENNLNPSVSLLSIYSGENDSSHKTVTFRVNLVSYSKTLTSKEAADEIKKIETAVNKAHDGEVV